MYNRILLKLSGEALAGTSNGYDAEVLARIANEVKEITEMGIQVAIVVGGGNFIRGQVCGTNGNRSCAGRLHGHAGNGDQFNRHPRCL